VRVVSGPRPGTDRRSTRVGALAATIALAVAAGLLPAAPAHAEGASCAPACGDGGASSGPGGVVADAGADRGPGGGGPAQSSIRGPHHDPCTYQSLSAHDLLAWHMAYADQGNDSPPEPPPDAFYGTDPDARWAIAHCPPDAGREVLTWWAIGTRPPASLIDALRLQARDAVPFPVLAQAAAPSGDRGAPFIAQLPTWLWVDPAGWRPVQAEAAIPGIVTVTARARPTGLQWRPGTGDPPVRCAGPGTPYDPARPEAAQASSCTYAYRHSSDVAPGGGPYSLTMGVTWEIDWSCTPGCGGGPMAPVTVTTTRPVWVAELQAITSGRTAGP
jgi:hypothetical protein